MKNTVNYKSRFRILKGGKISLVVSALLVGSIVNVAKAADIVIGSGTTKVTQTLTEASTITVNGDLNVTASTRAIEITTAGNTHTLTNNASISDSNNAGASAVYYTDGVGSDSSIVNSGTIEAISTANAVTASGISVTDSMDGTITNNAGATISATSTQSRAYGVHLLDGMGTGSSIVNSGTIEATDTTSGNAYGIRSHYTSLSDGTITNNVGGVISATTDTGSAYAIDIEETVGSNLSIVNHGIIQANAGNGGTYGIIFVRDMTNGSSVLNTGTISSTATGASATATGIDFREEANGTITNNAGGTISATSQSLSYGFLLRNMGTDFSLVNSGTIEATVTTSGSAYGIGSIANHSVDGTITNNLGGVISATSTGTGNAIGIDMKGTIGSNFSIQNGGTIKGNTTSGNAQGIVLEKEMTNGSSILNTGTIYATATTTGNADAIYIKGMEVGSSLVNSGTIEADTTSATVKGIGSDASGTLDGTITNNVGGVISATSDTGVAYGILLKGTIGTNFSLVNSGTIEATSTTRTTYGLYFSKEMKGTITNNTGATISASTAGGDARAIKLYKGMSVGSSLVNSGTIQATSTSNTVDSYAIYVDESMNGTITNNVGGTISATSTQQKAYGVFFFDGMGTGSSLVNGGTIEATDTTNGTARGIGSDNSSSFDGTMTNNAGGVISGTSDTGNAYGIDIAGTVGSNFSIQNAGTISATSTGGTASGINFANTMTAGSSIVNSGTISGTSVNNYVYGLYFEPDVSGTITNNAGATISATSENKMAMGIYIEDTLQNTGSIVNNGTISTESPASSMAIMMGTIANGASITNNGTIKATKNDEMDKFAYSLYAINNNGTIVNTGNMLGNIKATGTGTFENSGTISLPYNANGATSASITTFTNTSSGILQLGLLTDGGTTTHSQLSTTDATFENGSTIAVNVLSASTNVALLKGNTLTDVVTASTSLTINGTLNVTDNSALLDFEYVEDNETIDLVMVEANVATVITTPVTTTTTTTIPVVVSTSGNIANTSKLGLANSGTLAAAVVLDTINAGNYPAMDSVFASLNALATNESVVKAIESTTPVVATAVAGASSQISNSVQGIVNMRQNANTKGMNSGDIAFSEKNIWFKPFGSFGKQDDKDGINGFDISARGLGFGIDGEYASDQIIGLALLYTQANVNVHNMSQSSDLAVFSTLVYGNIPFLDDKTNFLYQLGYAWQKTESSRYIALTAQTANADYTTNTASIDLKVVRDYKVSNRLLLQPTLEATYRNFASPNYSETGADALNLESDAFSSNEFIIGFGTMLNYKLDNLSKVLANVNLGYDATNNQQSVTASYEGASGVSFGTEGIDNGRFNYDLGVAYERDVKEGHSVNFSYNYQGQGSSFDNHVISAKYTYSF